MWSNASQNEALQRWKCDCESSLSDISDPCALWLIVAGIDLFMCPKETSLLSRWNAIQQVEQEAGGDGSVAVDAAGKGGSIVQELEG